MSVQLNVSVSVTCDRPHVAVRLIDRLGTLLSDLVETSASSASSEESAAASNQASVPKANEAFNPLDQAQVEHFLVQAIGTPSAEEKLIFAVWKRSAGRTDLNDLVREFEAGGSSSAKEAEERVRYVLRALGKRLKYPGFTKGAPPLPLHLLVRITSDNQGRRHHQLTPAGRAALARLPN